MTRLTLVTASYAFILGSALGFCQTVPPQLGQVGIPQIGSPQRNTVEGVVKDELGSRVPGALIEFTNERTGYTTNIRTKGNGYYYVALPPGRYQVTVEAKGYETDQSDLEVPESTLGNREANFRLTETETERATGRHILAPDQNEKKGYGLYSYILFRGKPKDKQLREMYLSVIRACLKEIDEITELRKRQERSELNIMYVPVKRNHDEDSLTPDWILKNYDFERAEQILKLVPRDSVAKGPYIVSAYERLASAEEPTASSLFLWQNLTSVEPRIVSLWIAEFKKQASSNKFWKPNLRDQALLAFRNTIAKGASEIGDSPEPLLHWVELFKKIVEFLD